MGPGDDAPIVGGESAQSHPTRDDSYTHLNAMNPKDEAMSTENVCHKLSLIRVFTNVPFMCLISQRIHSHVVPFFLNVFMTITLRNADIWKNGGVGISKGKTPTIYLSMQNHIEGYIVGLLIIKQQCKSYSFLMMRQSMIFYTVAKCKEGKINAF